jgi:hypothetical protein
MNNKNVGKKRPCLFSDFDTPIGTKKLAIDISNNKPNSV